MKVYLREKHESKHMHTHTHEHENTHENTHTHMWEPATSIATQALILTMRNPFVHTVFGQKSNAGRI